MNNIATRMRKVREVLGWKQAAVAASMNISQQAFSFLEQGSGSPRIDTLARFCQVMNIQLHFLLAVDVPVTEETLAKYGAKSFSQFITEHAKLVQSIEMFEEYVKHPATPFFTQMAKAV